MLPRGGGWVGDSFIEERIANAQARKPMLVGDETRVRRANLGPVSKIDQNEKKKKIHAQPSEGGPAGRGGGSVILALLNRNQIRASAGNP